MFSGIWVEAPLLIQKLPERWKIPSMIGAVSQLAQAGPILLFFMKCKCISCFKGSWSRKLQRYEVPDRIIIYGLFTIGLAAGASIALFWDKTFVVFGQMRSLAFFSCVFCLAILDCTCTIVFLTYVGNFKGNYITGLYIGEGISSLLPSLFALLQGTGEEPVVCHSNSTHHSNDPSSNIESMVVDLKQPRFGVSVYFWLLFSTLVVSFLAFLLLEFWPSFQREKIDRNQDLEQRYVYDDISSHLESGSNKKKNKRSKNDSKKQKYKNLDEFLLLLGISIVSFTLYGFIPGLSSYSTLPYGHNIMHLSVTLGIYIRRFIDTKMMTKSFI